MYVSREGGLIELRIAFDGQQHAGLERGAKLSESRRGEAERPCD